MHVPEAVADLTSDLQAIFGRSLWSLVVYPPGAATEPLTPTLAIAERLGVRELEACAARVAGWQAAGLATPLLLTPAEVVRSLDAFPLELAAILADHVVVYGASPFTGLRVDDAHLRQACEAKARSHLLHLREGFVETAGRGDRLADLVVRSAAPLAALLRNLNGLQARDDSEPADIQHAARRVERALELSGDALSRVVALDGPHSLSAGEARALFPSYLAAVEALVGHLDLWTAP